MSQALSESSPKDRLATIGLDMALAGGMRALSARALAERLGASHSTMNYHFGSRALFVAAVQTRAVARSQAWRLSRTGAGSGAAPWTTTPDVFLAMLQDWFSETGALQVLLFELETEAESNPVLLAMAKAEAEEGEAFWRRLALEAGEDGPAGLAWSDLALGLRLTFAPEPDPVVRSLWMGGALQRFAERAAGHPPAPRRQARNGDAVKRLHADAPQHETAIKILDAALRMIAKSGAARMSQREVAMAAGVPLASVTYFFPSRAELIAAAFSALHRDIRDRVLDSAASSLKAMGWASQVLDEAGEVRWRIKALRELIVMSARDAALRPMAQDVRATRGATSISMLRRQGVPNPDQLDAFLFSTTLLGLTERLRFVPSSMRRDQFENSVRSHVAWMFNLDVSSQVKN